ncbi:MAG TPA: TetR family transcriptional regulator [Candidatus Competibacteraceae bacterium]|nr:TetR family transcriptional regulator [Candidatus Competibacteraceae bacterium]MCP5133500.1 TetR family transcriptional regulator [Gammaproteobacteria bacterium]HPF59179.1 TetR family transcriptional regulator [Candidatus Competibacteraceae bacterium]HRY17890.1 TetR family transcriptional regulator [Candidatus Competibacteraceae bacterium]
MVRKTKEEAQETRHRILDAAEQVFQRQGVSRTSLTHIAAEAGVTRGAIYWHFRNKADLYDAMIRRVLDSEEICQARMLAQNDPLRFIHDLTVEFLQRLACDPQYQRVLEIAWHKCEYVDEMAVIRDSHLECGRRFIALLEEAMRCAQEQDQLPAIVCPHQAAVGVMALLDGLMVNWTLEPSLFPLTDYAPGIIDTYLAGLCVKSTGK